MSELESHSPHLRLILDLAHDAAFNMEADSFLFRRHIDVCSQGVTLRFYRFSRPAFTVGYGDWRFFNCDPLSELSVVRRPTGGGVVRHGEDLNYTLVAPIQIHPAFGRARESYAKIHELVKSTLHIFGIETTLFDDLNSVNFKTNLPLPREAEGEGWGEGDKSAQSSSPSPYPLPLWGKGKKCRTQISDCGGQKNSLFCFDQPVFGDLLLNGKKVAGAGQKRSHGYLLHQGSIAWNLLCEKQSCLTKEVFQYSLALEFSKLLELSLQPVSFSAEELSSIGNIFHPSEVLSGLTRSSSRENCEANADKSKIQV